MKKKIRDEWVAALRSGKYTQTQGMLHLGGSYCCLGVLEVVVNGDIEVDKKDNGYVIIHRECGGAAVYDNPDASPFTLSAETALTTLNDTLKKPFPEIADWIEQNIPVEE